MILVLQDLLQYGILQKMMRSFRTHSMGDEHGQAVEEDDFALSHSDHALQLVNLNTFGVKERLLVLSIEMRTRQDGSHARIRE